MRRDIFQVFYDTFGDQGLGFYLLINGIHMTRREVEQAVQDWQTYLAALQGNLQDLERLQAS